MQTTPDLPALIDAQFDLEISSKAALQALTLAYVRHDNDVFVAQMHSRFAAAAAALGYTLVKKEAA